MAQLNNVSCYKGEAIVIGVTMSPVVDITNWTIVFTLKASPGASPAILAKSGTVVNGPQGKFSVNLTAADTAQLPQAYAYDIWRTDSGTETVLSIGSFTILQEVR